MNRLEEIIQKSIFGHADLLYLLQLQGSELKQLYAKANETKLRSVGNKVYFRGLIEFSNVCSKDCYYCGIRKSNDQVKRYFLSDREIIDAAQFAHKNRYGSVVLQGGELTGTDYVERMERLIREIKALSHGQLGVTLSLGEQSEDVYRRWFEAGAHRYLLRIESSNPQLYEQIHPQNSLHSHFARLQCLQTLREVGYQVGTGVMIGLPFQTLDDLANDLLFLRHFNVDMVGMGPYIEHEETPLYQYRNELLSLTERFDLALKMIAILRLMMPDINIAAATALQAIDPLGREKAVRIGANIIMPNITPGTYRNDYALYQNKPCVDEEPEQCMGCLDARLALAESEIGYGEWGDSLHFKNKMSQ